MKRNQKSQEKAEEGAENNSAPNRIHYSVGPGRILLQHMHKIISVCLGAKAS
jgi:hypothetical protein